MKNDTYYNNLKVLKQKYPDIYKLITNNNFEYKNNISKIIPLKTKSGLPTLEIHFNNTSLTLHSRINPISEIERIINLKLSGLEDTVIIIGFELGYLIENAIKKIPDANIFIFEPSLQIFNYALKLRDLTNIINNNKLRLIIEKSEINDLILEKHPIYRPTILQINAYKRIFPDFTKQLITSYNSYIQKNSINIATLKRFDRLWTKNSFKNIKYFFNNSGINTLQNFLKGKIGALVIGAGPSIEDDIDIIEKIKEDLFIIAVDTALKPLIKHGIIPDFIISVDPQYINSLSLNPSFYKNIDSNDMPILLADPAVYPTTLRNYIGKIILSSSVFPPGKFIEYFSGYKGQIAAGGSVAVTAFDFARIIGANPIIIVGLDLSYKNDQSHIRGSFIDFYRIIISNRFNTIQTQFLKYLRGGIPIRMINNKGDLCYTDKRMLLYKSWFEKNIPLSKSKVINATNSGLKLNNVDSQPLKDILIEKILFKEKKSTIKSTIQKKVHENKTYIGGLHAFTKYLEKTEKNLHKMLNLSREARKILSIMVTGKSYFENNKKLSNIEKQIISFKDEVNLISMSMQDTVVKIMKGLKEQNNNSILNESNTLYSSIEKSCDFLIKIIKNTRHRLNFLISESDNKQ